MKKNFGYILVTFLFAFASLQSAQATIAYDSHGSTFANFTVADNFWVNAGQEYKATLTDQGPVALPFVDNFDALLMTVYTEDVSAPSLGSLTLVPTSGSGFASVSFNFVALTSDYYNVSLAGITDSLSSYGATVSAVPVPGAVWFMGSALFALVGLGRRKIV